MKRRPSRPSFELRLDPPGETLWRLFLVGAIAALGAAATLWILALIAAILPIGGAYVDSETAFVVTSILWAALIPAAAAAKQERPYLLALPIFYALLGVTDVGIFRSPLIVSGLILVLAVFAYQRWTRRSRPRYR